MANITAILSSNLEKFTLERTGERNLTSTGELLAEASSSDNNAHPSYSGSSGHSQELRLYRTAKGKYVCYRESVDADGEVNSWAANLPPKRSQSFMLT